MGAFAETWRGIGLFKWPALGLIALAFVLTPIRGPKQPKWVSHASKAVAGGTVRLETIGYFHSGGTVVLRFYASDIELRRASVGFEGGERTEFAFDRQGEEQVAQVSLRVPGETARFQIFMSVEVDDGLSHMITWNFGRPLSF